MDFFCLLNRNDQSSLTMSRDVGDTGTVPKTMYEHAMQPDCPKIPYSLLQTATGRDRNFRMHTPVKVSRIPLLLRCEAAAH